MGNEYLDNFLAIDGNDDAFKEKTRMAEVAAKTFCRLNAIMKEMKDWRDDRAKLKCNIWRLKTALRVAGKDTNEPLQTDPLIEHQRMEMKRLEMANQALKKEVSDIKNALIAAEENITHGNAGQLREMKREFFVERERLNNEIVYLKTRLKEAEYEHDNGSAFVHLKCKLKEFMMGDQTMEIIFADMVSKVAETIANLSEELVNVSENLHTSKMRNEDLYLEIDRLNAMLRPKTRNILNYQKRIDEIDDIGSRLKGEIEKFKINIQNKSCNPSALRIAEALTNELKGKLKNDHAALLAGGNPDCLKYIDKISDLRIDLKQLCVELEKSHSENRSRSQEKIVSNQYLKRISMLEVSFKKISLEIDKLKSDHVVKNCQASGIEGLKYLEKIEELQKAIEKAKVTMNSFSITASGEPSEENMVERLEDLIRRVCNKIKELEVIVASNNSSSLFSKIDELEECLARSKSELIEKNNLTNILLQKCSNAKTMLDQKIRETKGIQKKICMLTEENKSLKERTKKAEERIFEFARERERFEGNLEELQQVKSEANVIRVKLQNLQAEKATLSEGIESARNALRERNEEIRIIIKERDTIERTLNEEVTSLKIKLAVSLKDNEVIRKQMEYSCKLVNLEKESKESMPNLVYELQQLKIELKTSKENLDRVNCEVKDLKERLNHFSNDKAKLEMNISHMESTNKILTRQLDEERITNELRLQEWTKLKFARDGWEREKISVKRANEQLEIELTVLRNEKESLKKTLSETNHENSVLKNRVNEYEAKCNALQEVVHNFEISSTDLNSKLEETRAELKEGQDKMLRLKLENSRFNDNLDSLTLNNASVETRVQVLLTEKNGLATRINELNEENVALKDQLDKAKTENEYTAIELNESRIENDKVQSKNISLQELLAAALRCDASLKRTNDELQARLTENQSEYRILENQHRILRSTSEALKKEKEALFQEKSVLRNYLDKNKQFADEETIANGKISNNLMENDLKRSGLSNKSANSDERVKIKDTTKDKLKRLMVENEALKFELMNLRTQNSEVRLKLSKTKDEFENLRFELAKIKANDSEIRPISNKLEIVNLFYRQGVNQTLYPNKYIGTTSPELAITNERNLSNNKIVNYEPKVESEMKIEEVLQMMDKLKIENVALKMEMNFLRCNVAADGLNDAGKTANELTNAVEEIQALKRELMKLRDEKESLGTRLNTTRTELDKLKSEKLALKDELVTLRKTNSDLWRRMQKTQSDYLQTKKPGTEFERNLMHAINEIKKHATIADTPDTTENQSKIFHNEKDIKKNLERVARSCTLLSNVEYDDDNCQKF